MLSSVVHGHGASAPARTHDGQSWLRTHQTSPWSTGRPRRAGRARQAVAERAGQALEDRLADVVAVPPVVEQDVQVHPTVRRRRPARSRRPARCRTSPILGVGIGAFQTQNGRPPRSTAQVTRVSSIGRIDVPVAANPRPVAERPVDRLAQADPDVLGRVVGVDVEVARARDRQVHQRVPGEELEHVVEEPDPRRDLARPRPSRSRARRMSVSRVLRTISAGSVHYHQALRGLGPSSGVRAAGLLLSGEGEAPSEPIRFRPLARPRGDPSQFTLPDHPKLGPQSNSHHTSLRRASSSASISSSVPTVMRRPSGRPG